MNRAPRASFMCPAMLFLAFTYAVCVAKPVFAQCTPTWQPGDGVPGIAGWSGPGAAVSPGLYSSILWDSDGAGPLPQRLVIGGDFIMAGRTKTNSVAMWDGAQWVAFNNGIYIDHGPNAGFDFGVTSFAALPNGILVAGGAFVNIDGVRVNSLAQWNGTTWSSVGGGLTWSTGDNGFVAALTTMPNGDLIVGGQFEQAGTTAANSIARWNGTAWSALGNGFHTGPDLGSCEALAVRPNGDLVAGGSFTQAGTIAANSIARWNGTDWAAYADGLHSNGDLGFVASLAVQADGDVLVGGSFDTAGSVSVSNIARFDGSTWFDIGGGTNPDAFVNKLIIHPNGDLYVGGPGLATAGGTPVAGSAKWDGTAWMSVDVPYEPTMQGAGLVTILPNNEFVAWDGFGGLVHGSGASWNYYETGFNFSATYMATTPNGEVFVANDFAFDREYASEKIARWDGAAWNKVLPELEGRVTAMTAAPNRDLVIGEIVFNSSPPNTFRVRRWNGAAWSQIGPNFNSVIQDVKFAPNGDLVAAGNFSQIGSTTAQCLARWNGSTWSEVGGGVRTSVSELAIKPNGDIVVGGSISQVGSVVAFGVATWNGSSWNTMDSGVDGDVTQVAVRPNGDVIVAGSFGIVGSQFEFANNLALWNGTAWVALGNSFSGGVLIFDVASLPNGDVLVGGGFNTAIGNPADFLARWNGSTWSSMGTIDGDVNSISLRPDGGIAIIGNFLTADNQVAAHFAVLGCAGPACDSIDFNNDSSLFDPQDIDAFLSVFSEGPCVPSSSSCNDIDFNNDSSLFDPCDIDSFLLMFSEGPCTTCGV